MQFTPLRRGAIPLQSQRITRVGNQRRKTQNHCCVIHLGIYTTRPTNQSTSVLESSLEKATGWGVQRDNGPVLLVSSLRILMQHYWLFRASLAAQLVKNFPAGQETRVQSLGGKNPMEKEMATHCSNLAWKILWTEEPGGLQSMGSQESDIT